MEITKELNGDVLTIRPNGRLDTVSAPQLEAELRNSVNGVKELVFDLADLQYVSSAGLRVLLSAQKVMNRQGGMRILNANEEVREIFEVTGFDEILTIE